MANLVLPNETQVHLEAKMPRTAKLKKKKIEEESKQVLATRAWNETPFSVPSALMNTHTQDPRGHKLPEKHF